MNLHTEMCKSNRSIIETDSSANEGLKDICTLRSQFFNVTISLINHIILLNPKSDTRVYAQSLVRRKQMCNGHSKRNTFMTSYEFMGAILDLITGAFRIALVV